MYLMPNPIKYCDINLFSEKLFEDNFLLLADDYRHVIYQTDRKWSVTSAIQLPKQDRPIGLTYDPVENRIFWSDFNRGLIKSAYLNGTDVKTLFTLKSSRLLLKLYSSIKC